MHTIQAGTPLPDVTLYEACPLHECHAGASPIKEVKLRDVFAGKKGALVGMPGAFTPCCTKDHLPSYINHHEKLKEAGCEVTVITTINDPFVLRAWGESLGCTKEKCSKTMLLADTKGQLAEALGVAQDGLNPGGKRMKRFSACIKDNVICKWNLEDNDSKPSCSMAETMCEQVKAH